MNNGYIFVKISFVKPVVYFWFGSASGRVILHLTHS